MATQFTNIVESGDISQLQELKDQFDTIRDEMLELETNGLAGQFDLDQSQSESARNLLHYLSLRQRDLRPIQDKLATLGLSSLGRAESHVKASVDAIDEALHSLIDNHHEQQNSAEALSFQEGLDLLNSHTARLLGPKPANRSVRIMVTMPAEAADDYDFVRTLILNGMDCMRINCAYDDVAVWSRMIMNARRASNETHRNCRVLMDLAGPKLRTGEIKAGPEVVKWRPRRNVYGDLKHAARIWLTPVNAASPPPEPADACLPVTGRGLELLKRGDVLKFFDARGASRSLKVLEPVDGHWWAESSQTTYIQSGTALFLSRAGRPVELFSEHIGQLPPVEQYIRLKEGDTLVLTRAAIPGEPGVYDDDDQLIRPPHISLSLPEVFDDVREGEPIWFDDGTIGGVIEKTSKEELQVRITYAGRHGRKLRADKGVNLPDSQLHLPSLTEKDLEDLKFITRHADVVGYSFVRSATDVRELQKQLELLGGKDLGIVLKIETRRAFDELANLLLAAMRSPAAGIMIARGDLAIECGWERMAEVQEEILWICEAAHMPVIWATQVLENLAKNGLPSRAEITDAAMGERAECVMLNKGPYILDAVRVLEDILQRMEHHQNKKRSMLRHLRLADRLSFPTIARVDHKSEL
ncbi:MAG TPA: pyruvate kinase [Pyrinomonadaceae bacterium]|nr:pyruvate kinase [Pyrinomonadaceae bacterium]